MAKAFIYKAPKVKVGEFFVFYFREARCSVSLFRVLKIALLCHEGFSWCLPDERCLYSMRPENTRALVLYFQPLTPWQNKTKQKNTQKMLLPSFHSSTHTDLTRLSNRRDKRNAMAGLPLLPIYSRSRNLCSTFRSAGGNLMASWNASI